MLQVSKEEWARGYQEVKDNLGMILDLLIEIRQKDATPEVNEALRLVINTGALIRGMTF